MSRVIRAQVDRLRAKMEPPVDKDAERRHAIASAILDEFAALKASRAAGYRGGVPIVPEDIPGKILGTGYTTGELVELAVRRVLEREHEKAPAAVTKGAVERYIIGWTQLFESLSAQQQWNRREDEGEGVS